MNFDKKKIEPKLGMFHLVLSLRPILFKIGIELLIFKLEKRNILLDLCVKNNNPIWDFKPNYYI